MLTYRSTAWWPKFTRRVNETKLTKLQRLAYLAVTGASRIARTAVVEVLLGIPHQVMNEVEAQAGIYRIMCSQQW
jgi:hypothetical protein